MKRRSAVLPASSRARSQARAAGGRADWSRGPGQQPPGWCSRPAPLDEAALGGVARELQGALPGTLGGGPVPDLRQEQREGHVVGVVTGQARLTGQLLEQGQTALGAVPSADGEDRKSTRLNS